MEHRFTYSTKQLVKAFTLLPLLLLVAGCTQLFSQARFSAAAPKACAINQGFQLNYTLENANGNNLKLPPLTDFQVISGPNTSTSMQWVNGVTTQSVTYSYVLKPKKEGTFKIGKGSIQVGSVTMESNELSIDITQAVAQQQQQRQRDPFDDPFFNQQQEEEPPVAQGDLEKQLKDEVFARLVINKNSAYKGEMLTATYKLYFRQNLNGVNVSKAPAFEGFWSQEVELDPHRRPAIETVNGKQYHTLEIIKYNLYPQRAGALPVASAEVSTVAQVAVRGRSRSPFDDFFGMSRVQQVPLTLKTSTLNVDVKELPENGKPVDFAGAVGKFDYQASLSDKEGKTDEPITYTMKISGTGNLKFIEAPTLQFPSAFEVYDPKVKENINNGPGGLTGSKQYDYLIIPRQPGDYKIEGQPFSYFDPASAKYFTIKSPEFTVKVSGEPSKNVNTGATASMSKQEVSLIGQDIRYIKTQAPGFVKGNSFFGSATFAALYSTPFLLFIGLVLLRRRNETMAADVIGTKRRRAIKLARKRLSTADKFLAKSDKKEFYNEVSRAIWGYLGDKLNIDMSELSKDNVEEKLLNKQVSIATVDKLKGLISTCELALYAPIGEGSEMKGNFDLALNLIADLEDEIK